MNGAFETVERVSGIAKGHGERLVIVVHNGRIGAWLSSSMSAAVVASPARTSAEDDLRRDFAGWRPRPRL